MKFYDPISIILYPTIDYNVLYYTIQFDPVISEIGYYFSSDNGTLSLDNFGPNFDNIMYVN